MHITIQKKFFVFEKSASEYVAIKCVLSTDYLSSAVNVLTKSLKIFHVTESDFLHLNDLHTD